MVPQVLLKELYPWYIIRIVYHIAGFVPGVSHHSVET